LFVISILNRRSDFLLEHQVVKNILANTSQKWLEIIEDTYLAQGRAAEGATRCAHWGWVA
jgi:hypothetical protein